MYDFFLISCFTGDGKIRERGQITDDRFMNRIPENRGHIICILCSKTITMEKRVLGIIFSLLGTLGLILAAVQFMNGSGGVRNIKTIVIYLILGLIFFFAGVSLIKNTKDRPS